MNTSSPHIVMLNKAYPPWTGGIERYVCDVSEALVKRGWKVTVLVCNDARFETCEMIHGVRIIRVPRWGTILSQPIPSRFFRRLRSLSPDFVHVHMPYPLAWLAVFQVKKHIPVVCTWHSDIVRQRWLMKILSPFEQRFLSRCNRIWPTSELLLNSSESLSKHRDRCSIIPLSIPPSEKDDAQLIQQIKKRYPGKIVLFVGRLVGYKGLPYLIEAMPELNATLLIAGDGPDRQKLEEMVSRSPKSESIHLLGQVSELEKQALYRAADVFVLPSISQNEAFGYVLLEAMMNECPLITTDLPTGVRWVNEDGVSGIVVPPANAKALAQAIRTILEDEPLRKQFTTEAKKRVELCFRFEEMIDHIESEYRTLLTPH